MAIAREEVAVSSTQSMPLSEVDATELLETSARLVTAYFQAFDKRFSDAPARLIEAIQYSLMAGGKRLRPALVFESARACQNKSSPSNPSPSALAAAAAMELIHTFSLVHDDLPAMDDDDLRRGRPTNHKVFGEAMAILAGDAMTTIAFEILAADAEPKLVAPLVGELAHASGPAGMIGGQVIDMDETPIPQKSRRASASSPHEDRRPADRLLPHGRHCRRRRAKRALPPSTPSADTWAWRSRSSMTSSTRPPPPSSSAKPQKRTQQKEK